ncbi:protein of unknown function DUF3164 [Winogradskyella phage Peternella_1]|uniref:DUF3164 family protein n=1 Tax=Winogradskyella phage Peternella_1 TaxID=2745699 RepID=A0A8E4ZG20_9CAUD|nr:protein of unknown function DUF3164 [Winogradskyella phage Peternella_1]QQV91545.1 protein of unknown function DUF3164 [Winogradskyella phage Peternella_1]
MKSVITAMENKPQEKPVMTKEELKAALKEIEAAEKAKEKKERKEYEDDNEHFLTQTVGKFQQLKSELKQLKDYTIKEANKLYHRMYAINDKESPEVNTFSRINKAQTIKITVDRQDKMKFTPEASVHINAIKDIFKSKFEDRNKGMYKIMDGLLIKGSKGEYDPKLLAKARRQVRELGYEDLIAEFDKLDECQIVEGTSLYCRAYMKNEAGKWEDVSLNFSSL